MKNINESTKKIISLKHPEEIKGYIIILILTLDFFVLFSLFMYKFSVVLASILIPIIVLLNIWAIRLRIRIYELQKQYTAYLGVLFFCWGYHVYGYYSKSRLQYVFFEKLRDYLFNNCS